MGKKSRMHSMLPGKNNTSNDNNGGCMWGLVSLLDFRNPRYAHRLLLDRKHGSDRYTSDQKHANEKGSSLLNHAEKLKLLDYAGNSRSENGDPGRSMRLLLDEEISKIHPSNKETRLCSGESVHSAENNTQAIVAYNSTFRPESDSLTVTKYSDPSKPSFQDVLERFTINLNLVALLQEFYNDRVGHLGMNTVRDSFERYPFMRIDCSMLDGDLSESSRQTIQSQYILRKTLNEILEVFLCDKINDLKRSGCAGLLGQSEQPNASALDVISLNKELFLKFLQDPNSHLAKYIQNLQISHSKKLLSSDSCKVLEEIKLLGSNTANQHGSCSSGKQSRMQKIQNIFRKKDKKVVTLAEREDSQAHNRIVVLKPVPSRFENLPDDACTSTSSHSSHTSRASGQNEAAGFQFSFRQIKRKMKQAIERKKDQRLSSIKKESHSSSMDSIQKTRPRDRYSGEPTRRIPISEVYANSKGLNPYGDLLTQPPFDIKLTEKKPCLEDILVTNAKRSSSMDRESNFQKEARKHIVDMLDFGYGDFRPSTKVSRSLEKMLSTHEGNSSAKHGPGRQKNFEFKIEVSTGNEPAFQNDTKKVSERKYDLGGSPEIDKAAKSQMHELYGETVCVEKAVLSCSEESISKDTTEPSDVKISKVTSHLTSDVTIGGTSGMDSPNDGDRSHPHLRLGVIEVDQQILTPLAPPGVLLIKNRATSECFTEKPKHPSPVSVLDTSCSDDCDSCKSTETIKIESAELPVSPRNLQFEEDGDEVILTTDENYMQQCTYEDLRFEYVRSLLEASGVASEESWWRCHSSQYLLHPSLYHQVETTTGDYLDDLKLLFDCVNEVLEEIRSSHCTRMPWVSFIQPNVRPFPLDEDLVEEVWKGVNNVEDSSLHNGTLDQIIGRKLETTTWMDIRSVVSEIGVALEDEIWEDILEETMLALWV